MVLSSRRINVRDVLLRQQADCGGSKRRRFLRRGRRGRGGDERGRWIGLPMPRDTQGAAATTVAEERSATTAPAPSSAYTATAPCEHPHPRAHHLRTRRCRASQTQPLPPASDQAQGTSILIALLSAGSHSSSSVSRLRFF